MKVGILTYHRAENYGALLQAYALLTYLRELGHDVSFVDYWPEYHEDYFRIFPIKRFKEGKLSIKLYCLYMALVWGVARYKRKRVFQSFIRDYLGLGKDIKYKTDKDTCFEFDLVFYGSDQIWREQKLPGHNGRDFWYWGADNIHANKFAFAASMGSSTWDETETPLLIAYLNGFSAISVRENSLKILLENNGINVALVSDPVFLLNKSQWKALEESSKIPYSNPGKHFILFYNLLNSFESSQFAEELSRKIHLPIIEITKAYGFDKLGKRYVHDVSIPNFLNLIEHAEYVVSNSFHGVALSIIFEKQFFAVGMGTRSDRVCSLLQTLHLESRYIDEPKLDISTRINYEEVKGLMIKLGEGSKAFIEKALDNE